jgi:hypothetical protein
VRVVGESDGLPLELAELPLQGDCGVDQAARIPRVRSLYEAGGRFAREPHAGNLNWPSRCVQVERCPHNGSLLAQNVRYRKFTPK